MMQRVANIQGKKMQTITKAVQRRVAPFLCSAASVAVLSVADLALPGSMAWALNPGTGSSLQHQRKENSPVVEVVVRPGRAVRQTTDVRPRGRAARPARGRRGP